VVAAVARQGQALDPANLDALAAWTDRIAADPRVARVDSIMSLDPRIPAEMAKLALALPGPPSDPFFRAAAADLVRDDLARVRVISKERMLHPDSLALVGALRNSPPDAFAAFVSGGSALTVDYVNTLYRDFPIAIAAILAVTYLVLVALFRSVLLPLKAILMNLVSIAASYGALVVVFQDGGLQWLLGIPAQGVIEASIPVLMFCALFGLSMDYEVFMLSRIQEAHRETGDNTAAVALGLERSGRIVTSAALIVVAVSLAFLTADIILVKAIGLGMAIAVALDATLVRGLLAPATMRLLGEWNWWMPAWLDRIVPRLEHRA
jgi:RND superfamily putative drug exporter